MLGEKVVKGYVIPLGKVNLVCAITGRGMVGCGAFDVYALDRYGIPAARVRPSKDAIADLKDLLEGVVKDVNEAGADLGLKVGISGKEALEAL